jgi:lysophospholipase L1-like esterase
MIIFSIIALFTVLLILALVIGSIWFYIRIYQTNTYHTYWIERAKQSGELLYVALGDSAAQGIGSTNPTKSYVGVIASKLQTKTGKSIQVINLSKSGAKIQDLVKEQLPKLQKVKPDIVTVAIGGNDALKHSDSVDEFETNFKEVARQLPPHTYLADLAYLDNHHGYEYSLRSHQILDELSEKYQLNPVHLRETTEPHFKDISFYAIDFLHPSDKSYKVWADTFLKEIEKNI